MRRLLILLVCCAAVCGVAQQSIRDVDWKNFSYPLVEGRGVPTKLKWMPIVGRMETVSLIKGLGLLPGCGDDVPSCPSVSFDTAQYGAITGIKSTIAAVVLTYHSGGTANWQYVYFYSMESTKPRLLAWLKTGSRAYQGLHDVSFTDGDLILEVNDPDKRQGDCCSAGSIVTRYRWAGNAFSAIEQPVYKNDPPSFDCTKAATPIERMVCGDAELSFLDSQMARSYRAVLKGASAERREIVRRQQTEWFAEYKRACNAPLSDEQRHDCIDEHLTDRLVTIWK